LKHAVLCAVCQKPIAHHFTAVEGNLNKQTQKRIHTITNKHKHTDGKYVDNDCLETYHSDEFKQDPSKFIHKSKKQKEKDLRAMYTSHETTTTMSSTMGTTLSNNNSSNTTNHSTSLPFPKVKDNNKKE